MTQLEDLKGSVQQLKDQETLVVTFIVDLEAKLAVVPPSSDPVVAAAITDINSVVTDFRAALAPVVSVPLPPPVVAAV